MKVPLEVVRLELLHAANNAAGQRREPPMRRSTHKHIKRYNRRRAGRTACGPRASCRPWCRAASAACAGDAHTTWWKRRLRRRANLCDRCAASFSQSPPPTHQHVMRGLVQLGERLQPKLLLLLLKRQAAQLLPRLFRQLAFCRSRSLLGGRHCGKIYGSVCKQ